MTAFPNITDVKTHLGGTARSPLRPAYLELVSDELRGGKRVLSYSSKIAFKLVDGLADPNRSAVALAGAVRAKAGLLSSGQWSKRSTHRVEKRP